MDMIDPQVAWVPFEYFEWGNPRLNRTIFDAMIAYSPYENIDSVRLKPASSTLVSSNSTPASTLSSSSCLPPCPAFRTRKLADGEKKSVPSVMITGGLYDTRVQVWEPVQYAAKLRHSTNQSEGERIILKIYNQGHYSGGSYTELVEWMSFFLVELGVC